MQHEHALVVRNVSKRFKGSSPWNLPWRRKKPSTEPTEIVAVDNVSFTVRRNEIYGILGPNGSGKSTLIRLLCTLLIPDTGTVEVFGLDVQKHEMEVKRLINRVSVDAAFFKKLSPQENLLYGARLYGVPGKEADEKAREILGRLGLRPNSYTAPMEDMSRGMQQKVAIARAFLSQPILLLLDEPTTGLDPRSKHEVQDFVIELREQHGATIIITTHDMGEAEALCERIAILDEGRIVAEDTPEGLKARVPSKNGTPPSLEDVFMELTGKQLLVEDEDPDRITIEVPSNGKHHDEILAEPEKISEPMV
jgi:ABC-2 type transport system ATP-binding protein